MNDLGWPLEEEGNGDNADSQEAHLFGHTSDLGGSACTGATAHTGGDEDHLRAIVEHSADIVLPSLCSTFGTCRIVACAESLGASTSEGALDGHVRA